MRSQEISILMATMKATDADNESADSEQPDLPERLCPICNKRAPLRCGACSGVWYCSKGMFVCYASSSNVLLCMYSLSILTEHHGDQITRFNTGETDTKVNVKLVQKQTNRCPLRGPN